LIVVALVLGGAVAWAAVTALEWKARYLRARGQEKTHAYLSGLELRERAERLAWVLKDAEGAREAALAAEEEFLRAQEQTPDSAELFVEIGRCRALRFDYAGACDHLARGLEGEDNLRARFELGMLFLTRWLLRAAAFTDEELARDARAAELAREAQAHLQRYLQRGPAGSRQYLAAAGIALLRGRTQDVATTLANALDPSLPHGPLLAAWAALREGRPSEALEKTTALLNDLSYLPEARAIRARAMASLDPPQARNARGEWARLLELAPRCAEAHLALGRARRALGEPDADEATTRAVELDPTLEAYAPGR
jgi:tetratricopeptide (TPR) repeat protein